MMVLDPYKDVLIAKLAAGNDQEILTFLDSHPKAHEWAFKIGASRDMPDEFFIESIGRYIFSGDRLLHLAAAFHNPELTRIVVDRGG